MIGLADPAMVVADVVIAAKQVADDEHDDQEQHADRRDGYVNQHEWWSRYIGGLLRVKPCLVAGHDQVFAQQPKPTVIARS